jgi:Stage II sporulation protein E (SpoIIE)
MRGRLGRITVGVVVLMIVLTAAGALVTRSAVHDQQRRLLRERTNEIGLVFSSDIGAIPVSLQGLGGVLRATHESPTALAQAGLATQAGNQTVSFALMKPTSAGFVVIVAAGSSLHVGQVITDARVRALHEATTTSELVPTGVIGTGSARLLGFALGGSAVPAGTVLYRQSALGPVGAPRAAKTAPFSELNVVLYASARPIRADVLVETASASPLRGDVITEQVPAGAATWTLQTSAVHSLIGPDVADAPWIVLISGLVLSLLVGLVIEVETRRRKSAVALYRSERHVAETLQRSLLPTLPTIEGLALFARYLPGAADQQVGGDWFDVFAINDGRIGIVIGDVVGHDIVAAAAMSQIQASLRALAWQGASPKAVLDQLDALVHNFAISELVTVFYGVLDVADADGGRLLTYANAGHLPPLCRRQDGQVDDLDDASSVLLGAPSSPGAIREQAQIRLAAESTLVLFTDGLVEVPGESLTDSLARLRSIVTTAPSGADPETLCDLLLGDLNLHQLRDDVAVLTIGLASASVSAAHPRAGASTS